MWSRRISDFRHQKNWSQAELAAHLGVTQASVSHWERGKAEPAGLAALKLETLLDQSEASRTLNSLRDTVRLAREICILIQVKDEIAYLDCYSEPARSQLGVFTESDIGRPVAELLGQSHSTNWSAMLDLGLLSEDQPTMRVHFAMRKDRKTVLGVSVNTPFRIQGEVWVRSSLDPLDPVTAADVFATTPAVERLR